MASLLDYSHAAAHETAAEVRREERCGASGFGGEGGALSVARLRGGGRIVKVLGHQEMPGELRRPRAAWWAAQWRRADFVVLNLGHHMRNVDGSFNSYYRVVLDAIGTARELGKPQSQLIFRTSNVGHHGCEAAAEPLPSRDAAWAELGGWAWTPPKKTSWFKMASTLSDDTAPSASLDHLEAQAAPTHP